MIRDVISLLLMRNRMKLSKKIFIISFGIILMPIALFSMDSIDIDQALYDDFGNPVEIEYFRRPSYQNSSPEIQLRMRKLEILRRRAVERERQEDEERKSFDQTMINAFEYALQVSNKKVKEQIINLAIERNISLKEFGKKLVSKFISYNKIDSLRGLEERMGDFVDLVESAVLDGDNNYSAREVLGWVEIISTFSSDSTSEEDLTHKHSQGACEICCKDIGTEWYVVGNDGTEKIYCYQHRPNYYY